MTATATRTLPSLRPYQAEAGRAIAASAVGGRGLSFTVVMARQAGKNELSAQLELYLLLKHASGQGGDAVKCAPTFEPQCLISMRRLWERIAQAGLEGAASREEGRAVRLGRARQLFLSAEPGANVMGHTARVLLEVDEAQDVEPEKFDRDFRPMAAPFAAATVYYGTPWDGSTLLEQAVQTGLEAEARDGIRRHFSADWAVVAEHNPRYAVYVEGERRRLGEDHPLFRTQYALKTVPGSGRLFSASQRAQLQGSHPRQSGSREGETYVAALDVGGQAFDERAGREHDASVLTIARIVPPEPGALVQEPRLEVVEDVSATGEPHDALFARYADLLDRVWNARRLAVDATGLGETMARLLARALGEDRVRPVRLSAESKSRLGYELLAAVNGGRLRMYAADGSPEYAQFWQEMERARVAYRSGRTMSFFVEPAEGHDGYLMSLALLMEACRGMDARPRIARGRTPAGVS